MSMDNSKNFESQTPAPQYGSETRTDELETPQEKFNKTIKSLDETYQGINDEPDTQKRRGLLENSIPVLVSSIAEMGGIPNMSENDLKTFFESVSHAISGEAVFNELTVKERYQLFKPALDLIKDNADLISEGNLYYYYPLNFAENYDEELANFISDPESYREPTVIRDVSMAEWDLKKIEETDNEDLILPKFFSEEYISVTKREMVMGGNERPDDLNFAFFDLSFQVKLEDGKTDNTLSRLKELIDKKGEKTGFIFAITFLNSFTGERVREDGTLTGNESNVISEDLQKFLVDQVQNYLNSMISVNDKNLEEISAATFDIERTIDRSVVWFNVMDKEDVERMRRTGSPTGDGYLNLDNLLSLLRTYKEFVMEKITNKKVDEFENELKWDNYARMKLRVDHEVEKYIHFTKPLGEEI